MQQIWGFQSFFGRIASKHKWPGHLSDIIHPVPDTEKFLFRFSNWRFLKGTPQTCGRTFTILIKWLHKLKEYTVFVGGRHCKWNACWSYWFSKQLQHLLFKRIVIKEDLLSPTKNFMSWVSQMVWKSKRGESWTPQVRGINHENHELLSISFNDTLSRFGIKINGDTH